MTLLSSLQLWQYLTIILILTYISTESVTIFLHRYQAHKAFELHPLLSHFFRLWLWLTTGIITKEWVAVHRKHHATVETKHDPHSPIFHGIWKTVFGGVILYRYEANKKDTLEKFGKGTPNDWFENNIYGRGLVGPFIFLGVIIFLFGAAGVIIWLVQIVWIPFWAAGVINGVGHFWGYRNYDTKDSSKNITSLGIFLGGEELHNNHHKFPWSARFSHKLWEIDITWVYLKLLGAMGLVKNIKEPSFVSLANRYDSSKYSIQNN